MYRVLTLEKYDDHRGYFYESYSRSLARELNQVFVQDNVSFSRAGSIRGLHYQWDDPMGKLVHVVRGSVIDYIVDIRANSDTYGEYYQFELNDQNNKILWVPPGYAHGFEALEDTLVMYKCTAFYNPAGEGAISLFDPHVGIEYRTHRSEMLMSEKDKKAQRLEEYIKDPKFAIRRNK